jgi:Mg2+ and Co2+ transporter CorA
MKIFTYILIVLAIALIILNIFLLDFNKPFEGNSMIALIGIVASFCAVLILLIFRTSKKIEEKLKN